MIQRIQTLLLFVAALSAAAMLFIPFASSADIDTSYTIRAFELEQFGLTEEVDPFRMPLVPALGILASLMLVLFIVTISRYRNRMFQMRLLMISMLLNLVLVGFIFYLTSRLPGQPIYQASTYLALLTMLMITLSNRFIRRDEAKVRAADRLR